MNVDSGSALEKLGAVVLAAGKGTRMYSQKPKVLHELLQVPMLSYVHNALRPIVKDKMWSVIGYGAEQVLESFPGNEESFIYQQEQLGTGHALQTAVPVLERYEIKWCLVVNGDTPLINSQDLHRFVQQAIEANSALAFMTLQLSEPGAYGRVIRSESGEPVAIIEAKDFREEIHGQDRGEVNSGIYLFNLPKVLPFLKDLSCDNKQGEYYITQLIDLGVQNNLKIFAQPCGNDSAYLGVNNPEELVCSEELLRSRIVRNWLRKGVIIRSFDSVRIGPEVRLDPGAEIVGPVEIYGQSRIFEGAKVGSHCYVEDCEIGPDTIIHSYSHLQGAKIGEGCQVGPFARLRPGSELAQKSRIGNFVEVKNSSLGQSSKANHLAYLGDTVVGENCNIGAGTITCNYDGKHKHQTLLGDGVFVGSNTSLVAPLKIGDKALIGAGSTITKDVPEKTLSVARERQKNFPRHFGGSKE
jgi:bifunctional UDP-N-acetylglucosamine pyrophosphorylase/glucosamine-1-phosphate N-acetyltransferase